MLQRTRQISYQMLQCKTEPWLHFSDNDGHLPSRSQWRPTVNSRAGDWRGNLTPASLQTVRAVSESFAWPCQSPQRTPQLYYANKHLKHSPLNKIWSICVWCMLCWRYQRSAECHSTPCFFQFYCLSYVRWQRVRDLQANKNLIWGPRDVIDWSMTCWLPTEPMD